LRWRGSCRSQPGPLAILALATAPLTLIVGIAASTAVFVAVAIADTVREGGKDSTSVLMH
jgi:hypothetical protein